MASQLTTNIIKIGEPVDILYGRLSQEDDHAGDSNSIVNQRSYLEKYAADNGFQNPVFMADDGYSGTNFDRPAWQDIVTLIEAGLVRTLIVKDMSRLGREYLKVGELTELYFPSKGVRFIAVNDGVQPVFRDTAYYYDEDAVIVERDMMVGKNCFHVTSIFPSQPTATATKKLLACIDASIEKEDA